LPDATARQKQEKHGGKRETDEHKKSEDTTVNHVPNITLPTG
jgi:hypothetical protein